MLSLRPTRSLARKLALRPEANRGPSSAEPLTEWYANDFRLGGTHFAIFLNAPTCLALVVEAAPYKTLVHRFLDALPPHLERLWWKDAHTSLAPKLNDGLEVLKAEDRVPLGVMVEFVKMLQYQLEDTCQPASPEAMSFDLCRVPVVSRELFPIDAFQKLVGIHDPEQVKRILGLN